MKLTKETLRRIIKEELEAVQQEGIVDSVKGMFGFGSKKEDPVEQPVEKSDEQPEGAKHSIEDLKSAIKQSGVDTRTKDEAVNLVDQMGKSQSPKWIDTNFNGLKNAEDKEGFLNTMISDLQRSGGL